MVDQILRSPSAFDPDVNRLSAEKSSLASSQVSKEDSCRVEVKTKDQLQNKDSQVISEKFPEAKEYLKDRLAVSIERRRNRFLGWRRQNDESRASGNNCRSLTELESKHCPVNPGSEAGIIISAESQRWRTKQCFPKEPEIESSQSDFICHICFRATPSEEAKGDLWM